MIQLKVNGTSQKFDGDPDMPLLWYLRDVLDMTGTKFGCGVGLCGACTVHVNGAATRSCSMTMKQAAGKNILTIEGLARTPIIRSRRAWKRQQRSAMRLLPERTDHAGRRVAQGEAETDGPRYRRSHARQHLPLRHLSDAFARRSSRPRG